MLQDLVISTLLPYLAFLLLTAKGVALVPALAAGSIFPIGSVLFAFLKSRRVQAIGLITLGATLASIIASLLADSPFLALAKGSFITATVGLVFALSLLLPRPLVFHLASGRNAAGRAEAERRWREMPEYRRVMRFITVVWALALPVEAALRLALIPLLPVAVFLPVSEALWIAVFALLSAWSWRYGKARMERVGAANGTA